MPTWPVQASNQTDFAQSKRPKVARHSVLNCSVWYRAAIFDFYLPSTQGQPGVQFGCGRGSDRALWLNPPPPPKRGQLTDPQNPTETDPRASEVTQTQKTAKNENGIFGISASKGFRKVITCHVFGETILLPSAVGREERLTVSQSVS